jgi:hypothetical protein
MSPTQVFKLFDEDNTGFITFRNLKRICQELGENLTDDEIQEMIDEGTPPPLFLCVCVCLHTAWVFVCVSVCVGVRLILCECK